ncbi:hypothetical protein ACHAXR_006132 [Thalassiosira sp. AJA248-18]
MYNGLDSDEVGGENDDLAETHSGWTKGVADSNTDSRVNIWSLNGYGEPVFTGGMYLPDEARTLEKTVKDYCASKNVTLSELCGGQDHTVHDKRIRGAWQEIAQCLPHRTVLSVYRRSLRQFHGMTKGTWSEEEVESLFHLVNLHGHRWKVISDKIGRSSIDCRVKFFGMNDQFQRGKWSVDNVELLLRQVRAALDLPRKDMDVREINQWTLENNSKIPWTAISCKVGRRRQDCYYKWKQMTKRSNNKAIQLGLEPVPMSRETLKFDVRSEYIQWKAEQDPKWRQKYTEEYVLPLLQKEGGGDCVQKEQSLQFLESIIQSRATRPSEVAWHTLVQSGDEPRERWDDLLDKYAPDDAMDLPLWKLARVVKDVVSRADVGSHKLGAETEKARNKIEQDNQLDVDLKKKRKRKKQSPKPSSDICGVPIQQFQNMLKEIVDNADHDKLTTKRVRKRLEKQLNVDLSIHKDVVKKMVKEVYSK